MSGYIPPQSIPGNQINKKKKKASGGGKSSGGILGGISNSGGGFLSATPKQQASSLAEAIEKQAAAQKRQANGGLLGGSMADPFMMLQTQLFGAANGINVAGTPLEQLRKIAQQQVSAQYDPQIDALMSEMGQHANRATKSEGTARSMYGALSKDYLSQLPDITAQYAAEDASTNQRYDQAQSQMNGEYQKNADAQNAVLKQLGVQAAAPDASQQGQEDQAYFQNQSEMDQQSALNALAQQQGAQTDYQRNLGSNAKMAGENTAQDIRQQLDDYLGGAQSQLTSLQGQRGGAVEALLAQLQQQDAARVQDQSKTQFDQMMQLFNFQLAAQKASTSASGSSSSGFGTGEGTAGLTSGLQGASNYLASQYPDQPILASHLMENLNDVLSNKDVVNGKFVLDQGNPSLGQAPKYSDVGQEYMMDLLKRQFEQDPGQQHNTGDINSTMNALLAYLGKLR